MSSAINFLKESFSEFKYNVEWPKWPDLQQSTIVVAVTTILLSIFLFIVDYILSNSLEYMYRTFINLINF